MCRVSIALEVDQHAGNTRNANKCEIDPKCSIRGLMTVEIFVSSLDVQL
jgi:hypothetical protein